MTEAERLSRKVLGIKERSFGKETPKLGFNLNNLVFFLQVHNQSVEAYPLQQRALDIVEKALGPDHPEAAPIVHNLGTLAQNEGKYKQAESFYLRTLAILEKALGLKHPDVSYPLNILARSTLLWESLSEPKPFTSRRSRFEKRLSVVNIL